ncbi:MAG TPA: hypothetical protein VIU94_41325, partial [Streptomyces sp.]
MDRSDERAQLGALRRRSPDQAVRDRRGVVERDVRDAGPRVVLRAPGRPGGRAPARADVGEDLLPGRGDRAARDRAAARTTTGTLFLTEDATGLSVHAPALDPADHDVAYIAPKLRAGLIDEMS